MAFKAVFACLVLASLALAGCASSDDSTTTTTKPAGTTTGRTTGGGTGTTTGGGGGTGTATTGPGGGGGGENENRAPTGSISASIEQGQVPVQVNFTFLGEDPDGDAVTWNVDLDGDGLTDHTGDTLPFAVTHNYTEVGLHNVTFAISDGVLENRYQMQINATAAAGGSGPIQVVTGSYVPGPDSCAYLNVPALAPTTRVSFDVDQKTIGRAFKAVFSPQASTVFLRADFRNAADAYLGVTPLPPPATPGATEFLGTVPADAVKGSVSSCGGGTTVSVTYTVE